MIALRLLVPFSIAACSPAPSIPEIPRAPTTIPAPPIGASTAPAAEPVEPSCARDADCGYAPTLARCSADPSANKQPPIIDQGIVCYCDARARCATLRVPPVPCESDASCAVSVDPRPHPVRADLAHPHQKGRVCRDFVRSTTCERTNICTMHEHRCERQKR